MESRTQAPGYQLALTLQLELLDTAHGEKQQQSHCQPIPLQFARLRARRSSWGMALCTRRRDPSDVAGILRA